jgi:hypothetical protein
VTWRLLTGGVWRHVVCQIAADVSKELAVYIFMKLETTASSQNFGNNTLHCMESHLRRDQCSHSHPMRTSNHKKFIWISQFPLSDKYHAHPFHFDLNPVNMLAEVPLCWLQILSPTLCSKNPQSMFSHWYRKRSPEVSLGRQWQRDTERWTPFSKNSVVSCWRQPNTACYISAPDCNRRVLRASFRSPKICWNVEINDG